MTDQEKDQMISDVKVIRQEIIKLRNNVDSILAVLLDNNTELENLNSDSIAKDLIVIICNYYKITPFDLESDSRKGFLRPARHIFHALLYEVTNSGKHGKKLSLFQVGSYFGRDHATVKHSIDEVEKSKAVSEMLKVVPQDGTQSLYWDYLEIKLKLEGRLNSVQIKLDN